MNHFSFQSASAILSALVMTCTIGALTIFSRDESKLTPGPMSHGHYQIELKCDACHGDSEDSIQKACVTCHGDELKRVDDSHPVVKFMDPRNIDRLKNIDARKCASCHREHRPELTQAMGVTLPEDYCGFCHQEIAKERPTHVGLGFETCATAGCHNFHDNSSLYESFLASHLDEPDLFPNGKVPEIKIALTGDDAGATRLTNMDADMPTDQPVTRDLLNRWQMSNHAKAGINCTQCHSTSGVSQNSGKWKDHVAMDQCAECHAYETKGFLEGRHGMRTAAKLSPMKPTLARLPMKSGSAHRTLTCTSCHASHRFDTQKAAVKACLECHNDDHSNAYLDSPHYTTWLNELNEVKETGTGVSCATCHMPRITVNQFGETSIKVDHNQNNTLRPNEKMIRSVCLNCHGLQFSLDSLADANLIKANFKGKPTKRIASLEMIKEEIVRNIRSETK
jgi:hypothetical protein